MTKRHGPLRLKSGVFFLLLWKWLYKTSFIWSCLLAMSLSFIHDSLLTHERGTKKNNLWKEIKEPVSFAWFQNT